MQKDLTGKVAVITASSTGIGKAIAKRLARDGCRVVVSSRKRENVDKAVQEIKREGGEAIGMVCHVGSKEDRSKLIEQTVKQWGGIDYLICNAAVSTQAGNFLQAGQSQVKKMWDVNYMATFLLIQEALPELRKRKNTSIVILSSYTAYDLPAVIGHYAVTKTALVALGKILAKELLQDEIRVNCIAPGLIKTDFSGMLWKDRQEEAKEGMGVRRLGEVQDIAGAAKFLVSKDSLYMTGQCLVVAGRPSSRL